MDVIKVATLQLAASYGLPDAAKALGRAVTVDSVIPQDLPLVDLAVRG
jgi:hypothetical protein